MSKKTVILISTLVIYITLLMWLTLLNREPVDLVRIIPPFTSYKQIFGGDFNSAKEIVGNIIIFIPLGFYIGIILDKTKLKSITIGCCISVIIELLQVVFRIGCFELDDILHNTLGTYIGYEIYRKIPIKTNFELKKIIKQLLLVLVTAIAFNACTKLLINHISYQKMVSFAAMGDNNNKKNILILNGKEGFVSDTSVYIKYQDNGFINIAGFSEKRAWFTIAKLTLEPGTYSFSGLSKVEEETVGLELESFDNEKQKFARLTPSIGPIDKTTFTLEETTTIRVLIGVYKGCNCEIIAQPVIYKEIQ